MRSLLLVCVLLLAGCSTASTSQVLTPDQTFLTAVRADMGMGSTPNASSDAALVSDAHAICKGFDSGLSWAQVVKAALDSNGPLSARQWGELIGAAVMVYCPQYRSALPS